MDAPKVTQHPAAPLARARAWVGANRLALFLFAVAFLTRLVYLLDYSRSPFFLGHIADALYHDDWARRIVDGDWLGTRTPGVFYKAPLYPYLMALAYLVSGYSGFFLLFAQVVATSLGCVLLFQIGRRRFGARAAFIGGLAYAFYFPSVYFSTEVEIPAVAIFLTLLSFHLLDRAKRLRGLVAAAGTLGLSILALPTNLLLAPLYAWMAGKRFGGWKPALLVAGATFATLLPCTLRNWVVGGHPTLVSANGGINFHIGNNADYDRTVSLQPGYAFEAFYDEPRRVAGADSFHARDRYFYAKGFAFVAKHPVREAGLLLKKLSLYFADYEIYRNTDSYSAKQASIFKWVPFLPASALLAFGLVGVVLTVRRREHLDLAAFGLLLALPCLVFFVTDRYRLPSMVVWALYAGACADVVLDAVKRRAARAAILSLGCAGVVVAFSNANLFVVKNPAYRSRLNHGFIHESRGRHALAASEYAAALEALRRHQPRDERTESELHCRLGNIHLTTGDLAQAKTEFEAAVALDPGSAPAFSYLGSLYEKMNQPEDAARMFARAIEINPWDGVSFHNYGLLLLRLQQIDAAIVLLTRAVDLSPDDPTALGDLAYAYGTQGRFDVMEPLVLSALAKDPGNIPARYNLASLYLSTDRVDAAVAHYRTIVDTFPQKAATAHNQLGVLAAQAGDLRTAIGHWEKALEIEPGNEDARMNLQRARFMAR